jgi:16S rRNA (cytosine967-C5)-methyltransferase
MRAVQRAAVAVLATTLAGMPLKRALAAPTATLTASDRAATQAIVYETLRHHGLIRYQLGQLLHRPPRDAPVEYLLQVALAQLQWSRAEPHAVVHGAVAAAGDLGFRSAGGLINAVLRGFQRRATTLIVPPDDLEARYNVPLWWIGRLRAAFPDDWSARLAGLHGRPPLSVRVNPTRCAIDAAEEAFRRAGCTARRIGSQGLVIDPPQPVHRLPGFTEGHWSVQDAAAQYAGELLPLAEGARVLDACAAPGGKTAHLLERHRLDLTAIDIDPTRTARINENLHRLGLTAIVRVGDAAAPADGERPFDAILLDAPCSASGTIRRNPDIRWTRRESDLQALAVTQGRLLDALWKRLKRDGKLLYATCSLFAEENQAVVSAFLERRDDARQLPLDHAALRDGYVIPDAAHDGFYYALLEKTGA